MAQQLWRTWSFSGLDGRPGLNIYAISPGLVRAIRVPDAILNVSSTLDLPTGIRPTTRPDDVPLSLSFMTSATQRVIAQRAYTGLDGHGRWGNYFAHVLTDLPSDFTAREAINLWMSTFWQRSIGRTSPGVVLPPVDPNEIAHGPRESRSLSEDLVLPIQVFISCFLSRAEEQRLIIVGTPDFVAKLITALCHALPRGMLQHVSFSTYEARPEASRYKIVGTCGAPLVDGEPTGGFLLPETCKRDVVINATTGALTNDTGDPDIERFSKFAAERLVNGGDRHELDELVFWAEQRNVTEASQLVREYNWLADAYQPEMLVPPQLAQHLDPTRAEFSLGASKVRSAVIRAVDSDWWRSSGSFRLGRLIQDARQNRRLSEAMSALGNDAIDAAILHAQRGEFSQVRNLLDLLSGAIFGTTEANRLFAREYVKAVRFGNLVVGTAAFRFVRQILKDGEIEPTDDELNILLPRTEAAIFDSLDSMPSAWRWRTVEQGLREAVFADERSLHRLASFYSDDLLGALRNLVGDPECATVVLPCLREILRVGGVARHLEVLKLIARDDVADNIQASVVDTVFRQELSDESRLFDIVEQTSRDPIILACVSRQQTYINVLLAFLKQGLTSGRRWNLRLRPEILDAIGSSDRLPVDIRNEALKLSKLRGLLLRGVIDRDLRKLLPGILEFAREFPRLDATLCSELTRCLASIIQIPDEFDDVTAILSSLSSASVADTALAVLVFYLKLARSVRSDVVVHGVQVVCKSDGLPHSVSLASKIEWADLFEEIRTTPERGGSDVVAAMFKKTLWWWHQPAGEPDLLDMFASLLRAHVRDPRVSRISVEDVLVAFERLRERSPKYLTDADTGISLRFELASRLALTTDVPLDLRRVLDALAPLGDPDRGRILAELLKVLKGHGIDLDVARRIALSALDLIPDLEPIQRRALMPTKQDYKSSAGYSVMKRLTYQTDIRAIADALAGDEGVSQAVVLAIALDAYLMSHSHGDLAPSELALDLINALAIADNETVEWVMEGPLALSIFSACLLSEQHEERGGRVLSRLGSRSADFLRAQSRQFARAQRERPGVIPSDRLSRVPALGRRLALSDEEQESLERTVRIEEMDSQVRPYIARELRRNP